MTFYSSFLRQLLFRVDAETAHQFALSCLSHHRILALMARSIFGVSPQGPKASWFGLQFRNPVGLAAGMDKNGVALASWEKLGFGFVEIGTVTAYPQAGNPRPRLFRFPRLKAFVNRMGCNNEGARCIAMRMERLRCSGNWPSIPLGINIGKSQLTALHLAHNDYLQSFQYLYPYADYFVLNVSSPNTLGLRALQKIEHLAKIIGALRDWEGSYTKPILIKIDPDLSSKDVISIVELAEREHISGLVATNTTLDHSAIPTEHDETGGLSGGPLLDRSNAIIQRIRKISHLPIIGSGGVLSAKDAFSKFSAGANLIQIYTGFIYRGPVLIQEICKLLAALPYDSAGVGS